MSTRAVPGRWRSAARAVRRGLARVGVYIDPDSIRLVRASGLPKPARKRIGRVVQKTQLWERERVRVAERLVEEFRCGLASGVPLGMLLKRYDRPGRAAARFRKVFHRYRSRAWKLRRRVVRGVMWLLVLGYIGLGVYYAAGRRDVKVDYLVKVNARAAAVPEGDRAWPRYRDVLLTLGREEGLLSEAADMQLAIPDPKEPGWDELVAYLEAHQGEIARLREAAAMPGLGFEMRYAYNGADLELFAQGGDEETRAIFGEPRGERLGDVLMPHLGRFREVGRLLGADAVAAAERGDTEACAADLFAVMRLGVHVAEHDLLMNQLLRIGFYNSAIETLSWVVQKHPDLLTDAQLAALSGRITEAVAFELDITGERLLFEDFLQRSYTDNGRGGGHLSPHLLGEGYDPFGHLLLEDKPHWAGVGLWYLLSPIAITTAASRSEMHDLYHTTMDQSDAARLVPMRDLPKPGFIQELNERIDSHVTSFRYGLAPMGWPISESPRHSQARFRGRLEGTAVGLALERYRLAHGVYPEALDALVPDYLEALPVDRINGEPLHYRLGTDGPVVYSVGSDGDDDGGREPGKFRRRYRDDDLPPHQDDFSQVWVADAVGAAEWAAADPADGDWVLWPSHDPPLMPDPRAVEARGELEAFRTLDASMSRAQVHDVVGESDRVTGSGIGIEVYQLADGSEVWLGWAGGRLIYIRHGEDQLLPEPE